MKRFLCALEATFFCAVLFFVVFLTKNVMERKVSTIRFQPLLDHAQEYDALFIGDSLMVNGIFPMEMWADYGIASYNMSSYGNTLPVTYWTMMNALDYADPELIVVGVKDVEKSYKLSGNSSDVHTAMDCYPLSWTKIRTIEDLMDDPYAEDDSGNRYVDMKWEYYFTLGKYHGRWNEIGEGDFSYALNNQKGGEMAVGVAEYKDYTLLDEWETDSESGWGYVYLRKIIEECQMRGIEVLLVHLPYPATVDMQRAANTVQNIADECGVNYIDFVSLDHVADYAVDCFDANSHLNPSGARKVSDYLGRYIVDHYALVDRREDAQYAHWHADFEEYMERKQAYIKTQIELDNLLMLLHDDDFSFELMISQDAVSRLDDTRLTLLHNTVREHVFEEDDYSKWSNNMFPLEEIDWLTDGQAYYLRVSREENGILECVGQQALDASAASGLTGDDDVRIRVVNVRTGETVIEKGFAL